MNSGCVLYVVNDPAFFVSHRLSLACALKKEGREVHVATGPGKKGAIKKINDSGLLYHQIPMSRSGRNPFKEIFCVISLWWLMVKIRPSLVHLVTIKAVLYGGIAARLSKVPSVVFAISGLGSSFVGSGKNMALLRKLLASLYRVSLGHANRKVIFQNPADRQALMTLCELSLEDTSLIPGSGVDLDEYPFLPEPEKDLTVTFAARLLKEKGVVEFVEAAKIVKSRGAQVQFLVIGEPD
ncbi:MAG: glycosyltransferase family 1 protein, partial [Rhodopirellula sp.]|nr:glycosyltransferase family 1 protein [Rhodopirellula sp.]